MLLRCLERATVHIRALGRPVVNDPTLGLSPVEIAGCITRTLEIPEIAALRPTLVPEFPVYSSTLAGGEENATAGIIDAIAFGLDGAPQVVVDWKSDVDSEPETIEQYRGQVRAYLDITGAVRGMIVLVSSGVVVPVSRSAELELVARSPGDGAINSRHFNKRRVGDLQCLFSHRSCFGTASSGSFCFGPLSLVYCGVLAPHSPERNEKSATLGTVQTVARALGVEPAQLIVRHDHRESN
jgi:hypothetical protein